MPSCNTRRMVETAALLIDHDLPTLSVCQWVLAVPKRLRYFLERDTALQGAALRLFLGAVEQRPSARRSGAIRDRCAGAGYEWLNVFTAERTTTATGDDREQLPLGVVAASFPITVLKPVKAAWPQGRRPSGRLFR